MNPTGPCKVCRLRRRKCVWSVNASTCDRCTKLELECIPTDENENAREHEELMPQDGEEELEGWLKDVKHLDLELHKMETLTGIYSNGPKGQWATALTTTTTDQQEYSSEPQWQISITNGHFRLETAIQTIDELKLYTEASLRYLSPFAGLFSKNMPIQFESTSISISVASQVVIQRRAAEKPRKLCFAQKLIENNQQQYGHQSDYPCPLVDYRSIVEYLVPLYIKHKVPYSGYLHVPTFQQYYDNLTDPLSNPVILAICVDTLISLHQMVRYSTVEGRLLAEILYHRCREMLFDMYDDPTKRRLDIIMITSFLQPYLMDILLNYTEARKLVTIAILACTELEASYMTLTPVERVLYQRHRLALEMANRTFDIYFEGKMDYRMHHLEYQIIQLETLDDESDFTKQYVRLYNQLILLVCMPHVSILMGQINRIFYGEPCELYLEDIISFQPIILTWWKKVPSEFRLCDDPFDSQLCKLLDKKVPSVQLFPLIALHMLTGMVSASLLQPKCQPADSRNNPISNNVLYSLHKELVSLAKNSNKVLIYILKKNWGRDASIWSPSLSFCMIAHILYIFDKLSDCPDSEFPIDLLNLFKKILHTNIKSLFPPDHQLPQSASSLTKYIQELKDSPSPLELYEQYPFPGLARNFDIIFSSLNQLDQYVYPSPTVTSNTNSVGP